MTHHKAKLLLCPELQLLLSEPKVWKVKLLLCHELQLLLFEPKVWDLKKYTIIKMDMVVKLLQILCRTYWLLALT